MRERCERKEGHKENKSLYSKERRQIDKIVNQIRLEKEVVRRICLTFTMLTFLFFFNRLYSFVLFQIHVIGLNLHIPNDMLRS